MTELLNWRHQRGFNIPIVLERSSSDGSIGDASPGAYMGLSQRHFVSTIYNVSVAATIVLLPDLFGPMTIGLTIMAVVILSIYRMFLAWTYAHIAKKSREVLFPFVTNGNPAPAIKMKIGAIRICASGDHMRPRDIFRRMRHAMSCEALRVSLLAETAA